MYVENILRNHLVSGSLQSCLISLGTLALLIHEILPSELFFPRSLRKLPPLSAGGVVVLFGVPIKIGEENTCP